MKVHFKRHGFADWLEILGIENYSIDLRGNSLVVNQEHAEQEVWQGKTYTVRKSRNVLSKKYDSFNYEEIERDLNEILPFKIEIEKFIESYYVGCKKQDEDVDFLGGVRLREDTKVKEVTGVVDFIRDTYNQVTDDIMVALKSIKAQNMTVRELINFIHDTNYKTNFSQLVAEKFN